MRQLTLFLLIICCWIYATELLENGNFVKIYDNEARALAWDGAYQRINDGNEIFARCLKQEGMHYCEAASIPFDIVPKTPFVFKGEHRGGAGIVFAFFKLSDGSNKPAQLYISGKPEWSEFQIEDLIPESAVSCSLLLRTFNSQRAADFRNISFDGTLPVFEGVKGGVEMLRNGSFEQIGGFESEAAFFRGVYERTTEQAKGGKYSVKCLAGRSYCEAGSYPFEVAPGTPFEVSGWYYGAAPTIYAFFTVPGEDSVAINISKHESEGRWSRFRLAGTVPEGAVKCQVLLRNWSSKQPIYFDEVHFSGIRPTIPEASVAGIKILLPESPAAALKTAQKELVHYLGKVVSGGIVCGNSRIAQIVLEEDESLSEEAWSIASANDTLFLRGGSPRGVLYATYHFLEDCLEIHWWNPWEESVPPAKEWRFKSLSLAGKPFFASRDIYRSRDMISEDSGRFAARSRMNRNGDIKISAEYGGSRTFGPPYFVHTFARYFGPETGKTNPEYWSLVHGKRDGGQYTGQLCLTNQDMRRETIRMMLQHIRRSRSNALAEGVPCPVYFDLSQNDGKCFCQCEKCQAMEKELSVTDILMDYVNEVAAAVEKVYPDVLVSTLAYQATVTPPKKIMPRHNVVIRLCNKNLTCSSIDAKRFTEYRNSVQQWSGIAKHLMSWDYILNRWPYPSDMGIQDLCNFYRKNNFDAIFMEMSNSDFEDDCYDMKFWLFAKIMENPDADFEMLRQTFLKGYYGAAAPYIDAWRKLVEKAEASTEMPLGSYHRPHGFDFYTLDELLEAHKLFDEAEKAVRGNRVLETHVMRARAPLNSLTGRRLPRYSQLWREKHSGAFPIDRERLAADMRRIWLADTERFLPDKVEHAKNMMESEISFVENMGDTSIQVPEPAEFNGKTVQHFAASSLTLHSNPCMRLIKDPDAREGCAFEVLCDRRPDFFALPFEAGCYDTVAARTTLKRSWDKVPQAKGFQWLHLGTDNLHQRYYIYLTRSWEIQASMLNYLAFGGKKLDVWVRLKFEGPMFYPDEPAEKTSRIVVDSISLVEL